MLSYLFSHCMPIGAIVDGRPAPRQRLAGPAGDSLAAAELSIRADGDATVPERTKAGVLAGKSIVGP